MTEIQTTMIAAAVAKFPATFGLRAFPGDTFRINPRSCYFSGDTLMLYTDRRMENGTWASFCKGTASELQAEVVVKCPKCFGKGYTLPAGATDESRTTPCGACRMTGEVA